MYIYIYIYVYICNCTYIIIYIISDTWNVTFNSQEDGKVDSFSILLWGLPKLCHRQASTLRIRLAALLPAWAVTAQQGPGYDRPDKTQKFHG